MTLNGMVKNCQTIFPACYQFPGNSITESNGAAFHPIDFWGKLHISTGETKNCKILKFFIDHNGYAVAQVMLEKFDNNNNGTIVPVDNVAGTHYPHFILVHGYNSPGTQYSNFIVSDPATYQDDGKNYTLSKYTLCEDYDGVFRCFFNNVDKTLEITTPTAVATSNDFTSIVDSTSLWVPYLYNSGDDLTFFRPGLTISLQVSPTTASVDINNYTELSAIYTPSTASPDIDWESSDETIATVDGDGVVTGVGVYSGETTSTVTITAKTQDGSNLSASCTVYVTYVPVTSITLDASNPNDDNGITLDGNTSATIYFTKDWSYIELTATIEPSNATNQKITWESNNPGVACFYVTSYDWKGEPYYSDVDKISGASPDIPVDVEPYFYDVSFECGEATITVTCADNVSATYDVTVTGCDDKKSAKIPLAPKHVVKTNSSKKIQNANANKNLNKAVNITKSALATKATSGPCNILWELEDADGNVLGTSTSDSWDVSSYLTQDDSYYYLVYSMEDENGYYNNVTPIYVSDGNNPGGSSNNGDWYTYTSYNPTLTNFNNYPQYGKSNVDIVACGSITLEPGLVVKPNTILQAGSCGSETQKSSRIALSSPGNTNIGDSITNNIVTKQQAVRIYPNPTTGLLIIEQTSDKSTILFYNMLGNVVKTCVIEGNKGQTDISGLYPGIYTIIVESKNNTYRTQIIKQ